MARITVEMWLQELDVSHCTVAELEKMRVLAAMQADNAQTLVAAIDLELISRREAEPKEE
jgi:hypothetical protein